MEPQKEKKRGAGALDAWIRYPKQIKGRRLHSKVKHMLLLLFV